MKTVTLLSGQTFIEEETEAGFKLIPAHIWLEDSVAPQEIALAFELLYEMKKEPKFKLSLSWLMAEFRQKYGDRWLRLFDEYLASPAAGQLLSKMGIDDIIDKCERGEL